MTNNTEYLAPQRVLEDAISSGALPASSRFRVRYMGSSPRFHKFRFTRTGVFTYVERDS